MPLYVQDLTNISFYTIPNFTFTDGTVLDIKVAYRSYNPNGQKTVLIPTAMGGHINASHPFNTTPDEPFYNYHVIVAGMLSNGESTSPSHYPPSSSSKFPTTLSYRDQITAHHILLTKGLGITSLDAVMGTSMGGQQAWYWAVMHGTGSSPFVKHVIPVCTSAKTSPHNFAMLDGVIAALETPLRDQDVDLLYEKGREGPVLKQTKTLAAIHAWHRAYAAWLTSPEWFRRELWRELDLLTKSGEGVKNVSLGEFLDPAGSRYEPWAPVDLLYLARMWQAGDVGECVEGRAGGEDAWKAALEKITAKVLLMPSTSDQYFRVEDAEVQFGYLAKDGGHVWAPIETCWGHIPFSSLEERAWISRTVGKFLGE